MKKTLIFSAALALGLIPAATNAQEAIRPVPAMRPAIKEIMENARQDIRAIGSTTRAEIKDIRTAASTTRVEFKEKVQEQRTDLKAEIETRKEALAQKRASTTAEIKAARLVEASRKATTHFQAESDRLSQIKSKIDTRMTKLSAAGGDVATAQADLAIAVSAMDAADVKIAAIASVDLNSSEAGTALKEASADAQKAVGDAQSALLKVVSDMRGAEASIKVN
ncbi:MAG TPA: hypothetical protein VHD69_02935 [Candidatus Paceibacterota bacterium]|nr:hypothetical protein [Candidatus Paceibacterota bacterium]